VNLLDAYLTDRKLSYAAFARLVGADRARIARAANNHRRPGRDLALAIQQETKGVVPASYWSEIEIVPETPRRVIRRRAGRSSRRVAHNSR
jgi:transcriptional regulator with XRE-family HTH domain